MPHVTCDLPLQQIPFKPEWMHLSDLTLADPDFGQLDQIDLLLGIDVFAQVICHGVLPLHLKPSLAGSLLVKVNQWSPTHPSLA